MDERIVIVRSHDGEPLKRVVVRAETGLVYVVKPELLPEFYAGATNAVGFPESDVYEFDDGLLHRLRQHWETGLIRKEWSTVKRYRSAAE